MRRHRSARIAIFATVVSLVCVCGPGVPARAQTTGVPAQTCVLTYHEQSTFFYTTYVSGGGSGFCISQAGAVKAVTLAWSTFIPGGVGCPSLFTFLLSSADQSINYWLEWQQTPVPADQPALVATIDAALPVAPFATIGGAPQAMTGTLINNPPVSRPSRIQMGTSISVSQLRCARSTSEPPVLTESQTNGVALFIITPPA